MAVDTRDGGVRRNVAWAGAAAFRQAFFAAASGRCDAGRIMGLIGGNFEATYISTISAYTIALPQHCFASTQPTYMPKLSFHRSPPGCSRSSQIAFRFRGVAMKRSAVLASISLLSACTAVSQVDSRQDGHLTLTTRARWSVTSWTHVKNVGVKRAASYCEAKHAQSHIVAVHTESIWGVTNEAVEVVFDCY